MMPVRETRFHKFYTEQYQINSGRFAVDPKNLGGDANEQICDWNAFHGRYPKTMNGPKRQYQRSSLTLI
jgi:hypothetical protein